MSDKTDNDLEQLATLHERQKTLQENLIVECVHGNRKQCANLLDYNFFNAYRYYFCYSCWSELYSG